MPDADDLIVEALDDRPLPRRRRRFRNGTGTRPDSLPQTWRDLLARWLARGGRSRWETLARDAGPAGLQVSQALLDWLLRQGWAVVEEERRHGDWWPLRVELSNLEVLRAALGLPDTAALAREWEALRASLAQTGDPALEQALNSLDSLPAARAMARGELLAALARWREEQRSGTRRDFALSARGTTKAVSEAEWRWLEDNLDLADFCIERHTPLLLISAPVTLVLPGGRLDLAASPDFSAITPQTLENARGVEYAASHWYLVENRTSFERVARSRANDTGVLWLPGFPPTWWRESVARLLALAPAPAEIACDPDPAGVAIALEAGAMWEGANLDWRPWRMGIDALTALPSTKPLNDWDRQRIRQLQNLSMPTALSDLLDFMLQHNFKGEQEGGI
jgi:hypothetical protein